MDALTRLIHMARPQAGLDLRCQLSGAYELPHAAAPAGVVPFHLVLAGSCRIESGGGLLTARAGDFILFPRGGKHLICDDGGQGAQGAVRTRHDGMLPLRRVGKGAVDADLLRETRRAVGDIGMEVGYQSEAAFGKAFRQCVGELPGQ